MRNMKSTIEISAEIWYDYGVINPIGWDLPAESFLYWAGIVEMLKYP